MYLVPIKLINEVFTQHNVRAHEGTYINNYAYKIGTYTAIHDDLMQFIKSEIANYSNQFNTNGFSTKEEFVSKKTIERALSTKNQSGPMASIKIINLLGFYSYKANWHSERPNFQFHETENTKKSLSRAVNLTSKIQFTFPSNLMQLNNQDKVKWILENFETHGGPALFIELLNLFIDIGKPDDGLHYYQILNNSSKNKGANELHKSALKYSIGRLLFQKGDFKDALQIHTSNSMSNPPNLYSLLSEFEIAQIYFRVEDFHQSFLLFQKIETNFGYRDFQNKNQHIKQFIATLHSIKLIQSNVPNCDSAWLLNSQPNETLRLMNDLDATIDKITSPIERIDKQAWIYCIKAFGFEGLGNLQAAQSFYEKSFTLLGNNDGTESSKIHISIYYIRFLRRLKRFSDAKILIDRIKRYTFVGSRQKDYAKILEEEAYLYLDVNQKQKAKKAFIQSITKFKIEKNIEFWEDWPIVDRLKKTSRDFLIDFNT